MIRARAGVLVLAAVLAVCGIGRQADARQASPAPTSPIEKQPVDPAGKRPATPPGKSPGTQPATPGSKSTPPGKPPAAGTDAAKTRAWFHSRTQSVLDRLGDTNADYKGAARELDDLFCRLIAMGSSATDAE